MYISHTLRDTAHIPNCGALKRNSENKENPRT